MPDFQNLEIAFRGKTDADLKVTYQLFKMMNNAALVKAGKPMIHFAFALHLPIQGIIRKTIYKHFVGGTSIEDCADTMRSLSEKGVGTILDYALEGEEEDALFDATTQEVIRTIDYASTRRESIPFSAFKITGVGRFDLLVKVSDGAALTPEEAAEYQRLHDRADAIFKRGYELGVPVLIDAEHSWIQPMLDDLVIEMSRKYNKGKAIVQNTYQMYRHDSLERLKAHHQLMKAEGLQFGLKIVRGAYMEVERARAAQMGYPSPIQPDKEATDRDYDAAIHYLLDNGDTIDFMAATHNRESTALLARLLQERGLKEKAANVYFAQLYGMSDNLTYNLADAGYHVVKYVPYGAVKTMMPYLLRRAEENSSVKGQSSRELLLIKEEIKRRRRERAVS